MSQPHAGRGGASSRARSQRSALDHAPDGSRSRPRGTGPASRSAAPPPARTAAAAARSSGRAAGSARAAQAALDAAFADAMTRVRPETSTFADLGLPPLLVEALARRGLRRPFAIQAGAVPDGLAGRDVLGRAATGSGKTLAFGLPMLVRLAGRADSRTVAGSGGRRGPRRAPGAPGALVLVPSRELALQVAGDLTPLAGVLGLNVAAVVGGVGYGLQTDALTRGVDLLVATPGRLVDLIERRICRLDEVEITAVDEADYMSDLGFLPVVTRLLGMTPAGGQRLLFSATLDRGVGALVEAFLDHPAVHAVAPATSTNTSMTHHVFVVERDHKTQIAAEVAARPARTLFFVRTKHGADRLAKQLGRAGVDAAALHGNLAQNARQRVMSAFAEGRTRVLVATDVAARGLHVDGVDLVVHYDPPADHKDYLHRSGRTARAGKAGTVLSFVQADQMQDVRRVHQNAKVDPTVEPVTPGHHLVRAVAGSGEPVVPGAGTGLTTPAAPGGRTGNRPRRYRSRGRRA